MKRLASSRLFKFLSLGVGALVLVLLVTHQTSSWARFDGRVSRLGIKLGSPDGLIVTKSLAKLPRDLLRVPLLKDLLNEDFVFYYERSEDRLGLIGSLRRIAYEHDLKWQDRLVDKVFDEPAELAFWRDAKGRAEYLLIAMTRNSLATLIQQTAVVALKDRQLTLATEISIGGQSLPVYALNYGRDRNLLVVSKGKRVVLLTDPGMLLGDENQAEPAALGVLARLLDDKAEEQQIYRRHFALPEDAVDHRVAVSANFLSFGYQHFFPGLQALRFDFGAAGWSTHAQLDASSAKLWSATNTARALPARAAACSWMPVDWPRAERLAARAENSPPAWPRFTGPGLACWYADSELQTPVFAAELANEPDAATDALLRKSFDWAIVGKPEVDKTAAAGKTPAPLFEQRRNEKTSYVPSLGRRGRMVVFSPDFDLVQRALDTLDRRYPSLADALPATDDAATLAVLTPTKAGELAQQAVLAVLPKSEEPVLYDAVQTHLPARLKAIGKYPAYRVAVLPKAAAGAGAQWHEVRWDALVNQP